MLNQSRGIVPQLVNQYNEIIEQNLCQIINLNEFRDNQSNRFEETIVLSDQIIDNEQKNYPDINGKCNQQACLGLVLEEGYQYLHQTNDRVLDSCSIELKVHLKNRVFSGEQWLSVYISDFSLLIQLLDYFLDCFKVKTSQIVNLLKNNKIIKEQKQKNCHSCDSKDPEVFQSIKQLIPIKINQVLEYLIKRRKHSFVKKTIVSKEFCGICGESIKFSEKYIQCVDCLAISHMMCASELPVPCIKYTNPNLRPTKMISNYVYPAFRPSIPALLIHCIRVVEQRCHETTPNSLYIMNSENLKQVKDLCNTLIKSKNGFHLLKDFNVNIICGVIKKFLSDFNESLIGRDIWKQFSFNMKKKTDEELQTMLKPLIKDLNVTNRDTLSFLVLHLRHLADNQKYICLDHFIEVFCPIVCGDTEVPRKLKLMSVLFQMNRDYWANILM